MTAVTVASFDAWMERCLITIQKQGGTAYEFAGFTETVDVDLGDKDIEGIPLVNGGRVAKWNPEADTTVSFDCYPVEIATTTGVANAAATGICDMWAGSYDTANPLSINNSRTRDKHRLSILWTEDSAAASGDGAVTNGKRGLRLAFVDGFITSMKPSFTDGILKFAVSFKTTPYDKTGSANVLFESVDNVGTLTALSAYTTSNKWR